MNRRQTASAYLGDRMMAYKPQRMPKGESNDTTERRNRVPEHSSKPIRRAFERTRVYRRSVGPPRPPFRSCRVRTTSGTPPAPRRSSLTEEAVAQIRVSAHLHPPDRFHNPGSSQGNQRPDQDPIQVDGNHLLPDRHRNSLSIPRFSASFITFSRRRHSFDQPTALRSDHKAKKIPTSFRFIPMRSTPRPNSSTDEGEDRANRLSLTLPSSS